MILFLTYLPVSYPFSNLFYFDSISANYFYLQLFILTFFTYCISFQLQNLYYVLYLIDFLFINLFVSFFITFILVDYLNVLFGIVSFILLSFVDLFVFEVILIFSRTKLGKALLILSLELLESAFY